jgi:acetyltransferase-like isoleucine patch superfamily enzyme
MKLILTLGCQDDTINIGKMCRIGLTVSFETVSHNTFYDGIEGWGFLSKPIVIEDEVWIGAGLIILARVIIHKGAVVAAGAIVKKMLRLSL